MNKLKKISLMAFLPFVLMLLLYGVVDAQPFSGSNPSSVPFPNPAGSQSIIQIVKNTIGWLIGVGALIAAAVVVYAAFQLLTSGGDPAKAQNAKKTILYAVIGYAILLLSWGIVVIIQQILGVTNILP